MGRPLRRPRQWRPVVSVVSDEVLMAYADGALSPSEREAVEVILQRYPECRYKVEKFRATLAPIQSLFQAAIRTDHLEPLIDQIRRAELAPQPTPLRPAEVVRALPRQPSTVRRAPLARYYPTAIAASVALLLGVSCGWLLQAGNSSTPPTAGFIRVSDGSVMAQGPLRDVLETTARGVPVTAEMESGKTWELEASFSFRSAGQEPCRRYELRSSAQDHFAGYACRSGDGEWIVRTHAKLDAPAANAPGNFAPASGPGAGDADAALDAAISAVSDGHVYQDAEEKALIARHWK